jgi:hypothetical protein
VDVNPLSRVTASIIAATMLLAAGGGRASATLDDELSAVDANSRTMTVQQWDTRLDGVAPLDRNRLTREWFHSGEAVYHVSGPDAGSFVGKLELGYQIGFPWSLGVGIHFAYTTPNVLLDKANVARPVQVITPNLFPGVSVRSDLGNGPGLQEVSTTSLDVAGADGKIAVSRAHGTVTGADGGVMLRPFVRLIAKTGESVTTYGQPWDMS